MKKFNKHYIIFDPTNKVFWVKNQHYGYGYNNRAVFETQFTDKLDQATRMTKKEAKAVLNRFSDYDFVLGGYIKTVDAPALEVREVGVTVELQLKPRYFP
jgi:hypothetical protein